MEITEPNVGPRIRTIRMEKGLSLRALAALCGMSANAISLIERCENSPTVSSLHQLALALDVPITDFFVPEEEETAVFIKHDKGMRYRNDGVELESLGVGLQNQQLEPFRLRLESGSGFDGERISHPGQEFVYCLTGEVEYFVGDRHFHLEAGDSLLFQANQPHCWCNDAASPATILLIFQSAKDHHLARQSHLDVG